MKQRIQLVLTTFACALVAVVASSCTAETTEESSGAAETAQPTSPVRHVEAEGAAALLAGDQEVVVLDIRTPEEYGEGHIKGAVNIDFYADNFGEEIAKLDREKAYLVHCASGGRSGRSLEQFQELGFTDIIHLDGGFRGWESAGNPVEK